MELCPSPLPAQTWPLPTLHTNDLTCGSRPGGLGFPGGCMTARPADWGWDCSLLFLCGKYG